MKNTEHLQHHGDVLDLTGCLVKIGCVSESCSPLSTGKTN